MKVTIYALVLVITLSRCSFAQLSLDARIDEGIKQVYNIQFAEAEKTFREVIAEDPNKPQGFFFLSMVDWMKILLEPSDEQYDDMFYEKIEDVIYRCDEILEDNPDNIDALFFKGGAIGFRGRLRALRESWLKAADDGREALPIVEYASQLDPGNKDILLGSGIYNYYASVIPDKYSYVKPLMIFFPSGDKVKGISQLVAVANEGRYAKYEARYFLMTLYMTFENDPYRAAEYADMLIADFPNNPVFQRWRGRIAIRKGEQELANQLWAKIYQSCKEKKPGYISSALRESSYYLGIRYQERGMLDSAETMLEESIAQSERIDKGEKESGFLINAVLYLGMVYDSKGERSEAVRMYNRVLDMREFANSHNQAERYIKTPYGK